MVNILNDFRKVGRIIKENQGNDCINILNDTFIAPPTLLPLIHHMKEHNIEDIYSSNRDVQRYINRVLGKEACTDTTIPLQKLEKHYTEIKYERYLDKLTEDIFNQLQLNIDENGFYLVLYELLHNIYKHSKFSNAYLLCQIYPNNGTADICMVDNGISIPGSFEESGIDFTNDAEAIFNAINGTTSDKEKSGMNGRGLNTSVRYVSLGFREEILIVSREGLCLINRNGAKLQKLDKPIINGTFISLRVNNRIVNKISLELNKIGKV